MKQFIVLLFLLTTAVITAQGNGTIKGIVLDKEVNNEPLAFATVTVKGSKINTTTDLDGVHTLKTNPGVYTLVFNFPGYQKVEVPNIVVKKDEITHIKNVVLSALTLTFSESTSDKESTSSLKR